MINRVHDLNAFKQKALQWGCTFDAVCYLDSNSFPDTYSKFHTLIAIGAKAEITTNAGNAFEQLAQFREANRGWVTGFFGYDLKNEVEHLLSENIDGLDFPDLYFFVPEHIIIIDEDGVQVVSDDPADVFASIEGQIIHQPGSFTTIDLRSKFTKEAYIETVKKIQEHITRGDIYVTNFCQEFFAAHTTIDPLSIFLKLNYISPNPFAGFFKLQDNYILCASPERFLAKRGSKLISQPIKGTAKRGQTQQEDETIKQQLRNHTKELQENVMIVDLVRNDLTRSAKEGTVKMEELFGIYSFNQLHQMISTVVCEMRDDISVIEAIKNSFPMGSMTGAPKISAMQLMEQYERSKRGVYSGAIGYFSPDNDFDFNVVIRTILYNSTTKYLSFQVGSAITYHANAEQEYEECLLKAKAILEVLGEYI